MNERTLCDCDGCRQLALDPPERPFCPFCDDQAYHVHCPVCGEPLVAGGTAVRVCCSTCAEHELWQARAFVGAGALGSPTAIVLPQGRRPLTDADCQGLAARIGLADTAFLEPQPRPDPARWRARFFSPREQLSVCFQALISSAAVLRRRDPELAGRELSFLCGGGALSVSTREELEWVRIGRDGVAVPALDPSPVLDAHLPATATATATATAAAPSRVVVVGGRARAYRLLADEGALLALELAPAAALRLLTALEAAGLCLVAPAGSGRLRLRVFTRSLGGREDVSTGGAVAGLAAFLREAGVAPASRRWLVEQGRGAAEQRGVLALDEDGAGILVGGRVEEVQLLTPAA